ncbi:MAG: hypothetical protein CMM01_03070 [Rhodopirellula sp.]|nr:hypothetical protein [Rhodopirellula sp.]OUX52263.1 MAG: hypothetical protein CBE43_01025 [Rhodopirellula sp. TMED283]
MTKWFVQQDESQEDLGPLRPSELLEMVRGGTVTSESMLRKDDSNWFSASNVGGLFEAAMRPTIRYFCPQCETEVTEPPVNCHVCGREIQQALTQITENTIVNPADQTAVGSAGNSVKNWLKKKRIVKNRGNESN